MRMIFFLLIYVIQINIAESSLTIGLDDTDLIIMGYYRRFITNPNQLTGSEFAVKASTYYHSNKTRLKCLNLLVKYQNNLAFMIIYRNVMKGVYNFISLTMITRGDYPKLLEWIIEEIRLLFFGMHHLIELKFKKEYEMATSLIKVAQRKILELEFDGTDRILINKLKEQLEICKFLVKNISIDFPNRSIEYPSLFRIVDEIRAINAKGYLPGNVPLHLSKLYSLLWFYLNIIWTRDCPKIFDLHHQNRIPIFFLLLEFGFQMTCNYREEFYPALLPIHFQVLYKDRKLNMDPIIGLLRGYHPGRYGEFLVIPVKFTNYRHLAHFIEYNYFDHRPYERWTVNAIAALEKQISSSKIIKI